MSSYGDWGSPKAKAAPPLPVLSAEQEAIVATAVANIERERAARAKSAEADAASVRRITAEVMAGLAHKAPTATEPPEPDPVEALVARINASAALASGAA